VTRTTCDNLTDLPIEKRAMSLSTDSAWTCFHGGAAVAETAIAALETSALGHREPRVRGGRQMPAPARRQGSRRARVSPVLQSPNSDAQPPLPTARDSEGYRADALSATPGSSSPPSTR
jgi:hypothetical protein